MHNDEAGTDGPRLGEQELAVLSYIAAHAPVAARDVVEQFASEQELARTTVLTVMERDDLPARAAKVGEHLQREVAALPGVAGVRGLGLLIGVALEPGIEAPAVQAAALDAGLVINAVAPTTLRLTPPLTVESAEIDEAVAILRSVLEAS